MRKLKISLIISLLIGINASSHAQLLAYDNKDQIYGAAAVSPDAGGKLLGKLLAHCSQYGEPVRRAGENSLNSWKKKHQPYLDENKVIQREVMAFINDPATPEAQRKVFKNTFETGVANMIDSQYKTLETSITMLSDDKQKASMCMSYFGSVDAGKWDLRNNDPVVTKFLEERIAARKKKIDN
ncbi:hypothetical protein [Undibacterium sp. Tian12W]|uniref:hypothetical protein n=1 Tax=Undibacterium sp. Tian12W TaxID=3413054 RepID=UPI003BF3DDF1